MAPPRIARDFEQKLPAALAGERGNLALKKLINNQIVDEAGLLACLTTFCRKFDADAKGIDRARREYGLIICYTLFSRSIALAGQLNGLIELIPRMKSPVSALDKLHASRWLQLTPKDRDLLMQSWDKRRREHRDRRTLLTPLLQAFLKVSGGALPKGTELYDFDPAPGTPRKRFEEIALACAERWGRFGFHSGHMKPTPENLKTLDDAFAAFGKYLKEVASDPLVFFQVLKWIREGGAKVFTKVGNKKYFQTPPWSTVWEELYLDACVHAIAMAPDPRWNLISVYKAKGLPPEDYDFFVSPLPAGGTARLREKLAARLEFAFRHLAGLRELTQFRRRTDRYARYHGFELLDEFETVELQDRIAELQRTKPEEIERRYARTASERLVFNDTYRMGQNVMGEFTIIWIETVNGATRVVVEFHSMDCVLFRMDTGRLRAAVETALYKTLAKNAEALKVFLLAYLEVVGLAVDLITAGTAGGFRRIAFAFIKERLKDKGIEVALDAAGIDNQALRIIAGIGANAIRLPAKARTTADTAITSNGTGFDPKPQRATTDDPFRPHTDVEKAALREQDVIGVEKFEARRAQVVQQKQAAKDQPIAMASTQSGTIAVAGGTRGGVVTNAPSTGSTTRAAMNGVNPPATGIPSNASRGMARVPTATPASSVDETVRNILAQRYVQNPPGRGGPWVDADSHILDAASRRVLGETIDLRIAGTGGIDRITARTTRGGELTVKIEGVLLPDRLTRNPANVGGNTTLAPSFNAAGPSNQFRFEEMEIRGPKGEPVTMQRAHLWGPGFGDEAAAGMFLAPSKVNLEWQNQMAERYLRDLATRAGAKGGFVRLEATATSWGKDVSLSVGRTGEKFLKQVQYKIELHMPGKKVRTATVTLNVPKPPIPDAIMDRRHVRAAIGDVEGDDLMKYVR